MKQKDSEMPRTYSSPTASTASLSAGARASTTPSAPTAVPPRQLSLGTRITARAAGTLTSLPLTALRILGSRRNADGNVLDADVVASLKALEIIEEEDITRLPVAQGRQQINNQAHMGAQTYMPVGSVTEHYVAGVHVRHYRPRGHESAEEQLPTLIYFHGGGWTVGSLDSHDSTCRWFCARGGVAVLNVDYRLAPEEPFPAGLNDATATIVAACEGQILGVDPTRIAVGGDSSGGNLATAACMKLRDEGKSLPKLQMLFVPAVELREFTTPSYHEFGEGFFLTAEQMRWYREHYVPKEEDRANPLVSPLAAKDLSGMPSAYVAVAGFDPLRDEGEAYARKLQQAGVPVTLRRHEGLVHPFVNSTGLWRGARRAMDEAVGALRLGLGVVS